MVSTTANLTITHRTSLSVVKASGNGILDYLQGQITQDIKLLSPNKAIYAAILTPQAKVVTDFHLLMGEENEVIFICPSSTAIALVERLRRFMLGYTLRIGVVSSWKVVSVQGEGTQAFLSDHALTMPASKLSTCNTQDIGIINMPESADHGVWLIAEHLPFAASEDESAAEHGRIAKGIPIFGIDWDNTMFPLNANLMEREGVSFDKGCYVGQEVTSRMHWRKGIKKKLYRIQTSTAPDALPCPVLSSSKIGHISSLTCTGSEQYTGIALLPIAIVDENKPLHLSDGSEVLVLGICQG